MKAFGSGLIAVAILTLPAHAADAEDPADPQSSAIEIAMSIGQLQALAELCAAPAWSYETQLDNATHVMPRIYADAGLKESEADGDIAAGRRAEVSRRDDPSWPLDCNRFRHQVSYVVSRVAEASGQPVQTLAPADRPDWRDHPSGGGARDEAPQPSPVRVMPPEPSPQAMPEARPPEPPPMDAAPEAAETAPADTSYKNDIP